MIADDINCIHRAGLVCPSRNDRLREHNFPCDQVPQLDLYQRVDMLVVVKSDSYFFIVLMSCDCSRPYIGRHQALFVSAHFMFG